MAYLFKRGSVYYVKFYVAGKQKEKSLGTGVFQIAKEKQRLFESARAKGEDLPTPTRTPIADIVSAYITQIRTAKTAKSAQTDIYYLRDVFGPVCDALKITSRKVSEKNRKRPLKDDVNRRHKSPVIEADCFEAITTAQIVEFVSGQVARRGLAPKTANRYREILTRLFNWAVEQKGIRIPGDRNPASKVERYRESAPNIRFLTLKQIDEQLDALTDNLKMQAMVATLIYAGLRREELLWLTHDDLDLSAGKHGLIRVRAQGAPRRGVGTEDEEKSSRSYQLPTSRLPRQVALEDGERQGSVVVPESSGQTMGPGQLLAGFVRHKPGHQTAVGLPGFPSHVWQPSRHERRESLQDQQTNGQFTGDLQSSLRSIDFRGNGRFSRIRNKGVGAAKRCHDRGVCARRR